MNILDLCKQFYTKPSGKVHSVQLYFGELQSENELYECIWTMFLYGLQYVRNRHHPEDCISVNMTQITEKQFDKVKEYMKSVGICVTLVVINKHDIQKRLQEEIKMYNYRNDRYLKVYLKNNKKSVDLRITNIFSKQDRKEIDTIFNKIDFLEYVVNVQKKTPPKTFDFEKQMGFGPNIYLIRFQFCYE
jgi:tRNA(Ile2) C34 agmatinyltransferase TiaS|tara:strand:+ start:94 stop:660 length:567 start_codon:yes stop_codon:yes gene_type:complete